MQNAFENKGIEVTGMFFLSPNEEFEASEKGARIKKREDLSSRLIFVDPAVIISFCQIYLNRAILKWNRAYLYQPQYSSASYNP